MKAQIGIMDEIFVDSFAGGGGASTGIELATGHPINFMEELMSEVAV